jgi:hypothetical protein
VIGALLLDRTETIPIGPDVVHDLDGVGALIEL